MSTTDYTRRLVEHRYGRPLEDLRRDGAGDPVLPILLRRLDSLGRTTDRARAARHRLDMFWQRCRSGEHPLGNRLPAYAAEAARLEHQEQSEAEAVWDLLDVRLLLNQAASQQPSPRQSDPLSGDEDLLAVAREVAARLPRLNRETLRRGLHHQGIHISNHRLSAVLQHLRSEHGPR
jgi:hypothetical protein